MSHPHQGNLNLVHHVESNYHQGNLNLVFYFNYIIFYIDVGACLFFYFLVYLVRKYLLKTNHINNIGKTFLRFQNIIFNDLIRANVEQSKASRLRHVMVEINCLFFLYLKR